MEGINGDSTSVDSQASLLQSMFAAGSLYR